MQTRTLGSSGLTVGSIGLGCMGMSWAYGSATQAEATAVILRALDLGVTLLDTADAYGPFTNEVLVGNAIKGRRDTVVLSTKCGITVEDATTYRTGRNGRPDYIKAACDASLKRLQVDYIDLYHLHRVDPEVPVEESVGAMAELVTAGKVRAIGLSEVDVQTLERAMAVHPIAAVQSELSLWTRDTLAEVLPWCMAHNVAFLAFSPLGRGFLTGRYQSPQAFDPSDFRSRLPRFQTEAMTANQAIVATVRQVADRVGATASQVALAWVLAQGEQVIPIPGTKQVSFLEENVQAAEIVLTPDDQVLLDAIPAPVGTRY
jgi:aryl-alcohol dehydrogenase-like predicted oxidoreductase